MQTSITTGCNMAAPLQDMSSVGFRLCAHVWEVAAHCNLSVVCLSEGVPQAVWCNVCLRKEPTWNSCAG